MCSCDTQTKINLLGSTCSSGREENTASDTHVDLKRCAAYEVTTLSRKKVVMKENPAYEFVSVS